jgi:hypothetical protein
VTRGTNDRLVGRGEVTRLAALLLFVVAAPVVGDIGSCGEPPADLDAAAFFRAKADVDCARCDECNFTTAACTRACDRTGSPAAFPEGCFPLVQDGEVCLRSLQASSCEIYTSFVADEGATIPTECNFCPQEAQP